MSNNLDPFVGIDDIPEINKKGKKTKATKEEVISIKPQKIEIPKQEKDTKNMHADKVKLVMAIQAYGKNARLGPYLKECGHKFDDSYLKNLSIDDLKFELEKQEVVLGSKQNGGLIDAGIKNGMLFTEQLICKSKRFKVQGTTEKLYTDDHYLDLLERVKIKYTLPFVKLDPVLELTLCIAQTAMLVHHENSYSNIQSSVDLNKEILNFE